MEFLTLREKNKSPHFGDDRSVFSLIKKEHLFYDTFKHFDDFEQLISLAKEVYSPEESHP